MNRAWNLAVVALLTAILLGVVLMPRFNYDLLVRRQCRIESQFSTATQRIEKVERLTGADDKKEKRGAALKLLDDLPEQLGAVQRQLADVTDRVSLTLGEIGAIESRLSALEKRQAAAETTVAQSEEEQPVAENPRWSTPDYTRPIQLPAELEAKARRLGLEAPRDQDREVFVETLVDAGIIPPLGPEGLSAEAVARFRSLFDLYRTNVTFVGIAQQLYMEEAVERMTQDGRFTETALESPTIRDELAPERVGIRFVKLFHETGIKRHFDFPIEDHPQIHSFNEMRENAKSHLVLDAARLGGSFRAGDQPAAAPK